jgi:polar amino acid transport system substrate-binding protein
MTKLFFILTTVFLVSVQPLFSAELTILTENLPPLNYLKENVLVGPSVEIVKEIQRKVGSHEQIKVYPWARAYKMALEEENVVLFSMTYTEDRYDKFKRIYKQNHGN